MGLFSKFKQTPFKVQHIELVDESDSVSIPKTNLKYQGVEIAISSNAEESLRHINPDYKALEKAGIEILIKANFIPWLKGNGHKNLDNELIYQGLRLTNISYHYGRIVAKYSPTKQDDFFGQFEFDFDSSNEYTKELLESSAFVVLINDGKLYFGKNFNI